MTSIEKINYQLMLRGMSGAELCRGIGYSNSIYSQWNIGKSHPSNKTLVKIAEFLQIPIETILDDNNIVSAANSDSRDPNKDKRLIDWFRSLPEEKQKAIVISQDGPVDAV